MLTLPDLSTTHRRQLDISPTLPPPRKLRPRGLSKFDREREKELVRQASKKGYLKSASRSFILSQSVEKGKSFSELTYINLASLHLKDIGSIGLCGNLKICILNNNYIKEFNMLHNCRNLIELDLHSNQISNVPGPGFWLSLSCLKLLLLHDNTISKTQAIHNISFTTDLTALTLYDTPLSLLPTYRHHVVNSIFSLKALDHYVISDEEIIEDAIFHGPYSCQSSNLYVNLSSCQILPENNNANMDDKYTCEINNISRIVKHINTTMAHFSPVLVIQRLIRGFIARKRYNSLIDNRTWATVTLQRFWRHIKGLPSPPPNITHTHTSGYYRVRRDTSQLLDYDTYINQQMAAVTPNQSETKHDTQQQTPMLEYTQTKNKQKVNMVQIPLSVPRGPHPTPRDQIRPLGQRRNVTVKNLQFNPNHISQRDSDSNIIQTMASFNRPDRRNLSPDPPLKPIISVKITDTGGVNNVCVSPTTTTNQETEAAGSSKTRVVDWKSVVKTSKHELINKAGLERCTTDEWDESMINVTQFRLQGFNVGIQHIDPVETLYYNRRDAGHDIRSFHDEFHRQQQIKQHKVVIPRKFVSADQRLFSKSRGAMALSCLIAVDQAYQDRTKAERLNNKSVQNVQVRTQLSEGKLRAQSYLDFQRKTSRDERIRDKHLSTDIMKERKQQKREELESNSERHHNRHRVSRGRRDDYTFANNFNCQRTSVSNALIKHDLSANREDSFLSRSEFISRLRNSSKEQHEIVKHYMQHRNIQMRTENAADQADIASKVFQETNDRLLQAQTRVAQLRQRTRIIEELYPIPQSLKLSELDPLPPVQSRHSLPNLANNNNNTDIDLTTESQHPPTPDDNNSRITTDQKYIILKELTQTSEDSGLSSPPVAPLPPVAEEDDDD